MTRVRTAGIAALAALAAVGMVVSACCTTIPAEDATPPNLTLRVQVDGVDHFGEIRPGGTITATTTIVTSAPRAFVQFSALEDDGALSSAVLEFFGAGVLREVAPSRFTLSYPGASPRLDFSGDPDCPRDRLTVAAWIYPRPGRGDTSVGVRAEARNYTSISAVRTRQSLLDIRFAR